MAHSSKVKQPLTFYFALWALGLAKLILVSDLSLIPNSGPYDDGVYVTRAFHLLNGDALGPYLPGTLSKLPGFSFLIAWIRLTGIPYLLFTHLFYMAAGLYFVRALCRFGANSNGALVLFGVYLLNPVTLDEQWYRVMREPLSTNLLVILFSSLLLVIDGLKKNLSWWYHGVVFSLAYACFRLIREEGFLLLGVWLVFIGYLIREYSTPIRNREWKKLQKVGWVALLPLLASGFTQFCTSAYIDKHYGVPITHEMGQGEFPKLVAAIRSVRSQVDNRHVMVPQDTLNLLGKKIPEFHKWLDYLPPPNMDSYSCKRFGVCDEWTNGWMPFWIKEAIFHAELTPSLLEGQNYFKSARERIESLCERGELSCKVNGTGLIPPFQLRWSRAFVQEAIQAFGMILQPKFGLAPLPQPTPEPTDFGKILQATTMTHYFESSTEQQKWANKALTDSGNTLAFKSSFLEKLRHYLFYIFTRIDLWGILAGFALYAFLCWTKPTYVPLPIHVCAASLGLYSLLQWAALSYVSIYMGTLDDRLFFPLYTMCLLFAGSIFCLAPTIKKVPSLT